MNYYKLLPLIDNGDSNSFLIKYGFVKGIDCPRGSRLIAGKPSVSEPFSEEALQFTKDRIMQREVHVSAIFIVYFCVSFTL